MGVAGANLSGRTVLITGSAGLLAGAFSMAMGEWVSVQSSRELHQRQLDREADEIATDPEHERAELVTLYQRRGLSSEESRRLADRVMEDEDAALDAMAREELGIDPEELGGSPWTAAIASFLLFTIGAIIPVIPFTFVDGDAAVLLSVLISGLGLLAIGAAITLLTGRGVWRFLVASLLSAWAPLGSLMSPGMSSVPRYSCWASSRRTPSSLGVGGVGPPWYHFGTGCPVRSVQDVPPRGRWVRRGRLQTHRAPRSLGWGPSGRWFKSSRPDFHSLHVKPRQTATRRGNRRLWR